MQLLAWLKLWLPCSALLACLLAWIMPVERGPWHHSRSPRRRTLPELQHSARIAMATRHRQLREALEAANAEHTRAAVGAASLRLDEVEATRAAEAAARVAAWGAEEAAAHPTDAEIAAIATEDAATAADAAEAAAVAAAAADAAEYAAMEAEQAAGFAREAFDEAEDKGWLQ